MDGSSGTVKSQNPETGKLQPFVSQDFTFGKGSKEHVAGRGDQTTKRKKMTYHGIQANIEKAVPQSDTTTMKRTVIVRNFVPLFKMRRYWKSNASLIKAVAMLYIAFAT